MAKAITFSKWLGRGARREGYLNSSPLARLLFYEEYLHEVTHTEGRTDPNCMDCRIMLGANREADPAR